MKLRLFNGHKHCRIVFDKAWGRKIVTFLKSIFIDVIPRKILHIAKELQIQGINDARNSFE